MTDLGSKELIYGYDSNQNVTSIRMPGGVDEITYTRDYLNRARMIELNSTSVSWYNFIGNAYRTSTAGFGNGLSRTCAFDSEKSILRVNERYRTRKCPICRVNFLYVKRTKTRPFGTMNSSSNKIN